MAANIRLILKEAELQLDVLELDGKQGLCDWRTWARVKALCLASLHLDLNEDIADDKPDLTTPPPSCEQSQNPSQDVSSEDPASEACEPEKENLRKPDCMPQENEEIRSNIL